MATKKKPATKSAAAKTARTTTRKQAAKADAAKATPKVVGQNKTKDEAYCGIRGFFKRKYNPEGETILTIFKSPRIYGALIAEFVGVLLLTLFFLSFGALEAVGMNLSFQLNTQILFVVLGITLVTFGISGANLNPIITAGLLATRRMSAIRGVLYILAQIIGAWAGLLIVGAFKAGGGEAAEAAVKLPSVTAITADTNFWLYAVLGLVSAIIIGFFFSRALRYKRSAFTFAAIVAGGVLVAMLTVFAIQTSFFDYPTNYNLANNVFTFNNPALALMYQGFIPTSGELGAVLGQLGLNLSVFVAFPVVGSVAGFYLSEAAGRLSGDGTCDDSCRC
jgi:glycerol uptake facilitator-like aquaporin